MIDDEMRDDDRLFMNPRLEAIRCFHPVKNRSDFEKCIRSERVKKLLVWE